MTLSWVTHTCITPRSLDGDFNTFGDVTKPCGAVRWSDGTIYGQCGEPCSWIMGKAGYGEPPWETNPDGTRFNPTIPDDEQPR